MGWPELFERGRRRGGFVVRQDPPECGVDIDDYDSRVHRERWQRIYVGTRMLPGVSLTPLVRVRAAAASVKGEAAADRWTAAWLLGGRSRPPMPPMLVVPRNRRPRRQDHLVIRRTAIWLPEHGVVVNGVRSLGAPRLIVDLAHLGVGKVPLTDLALRLRRKNDLGGDAIREIAALYARLNGRTVLEELAILLDTIGSESGLEQLARERLADAGYDADDLQLTIDTVNGRRRLDIVFLRAKIGIEVQSMEYHGDMPAMTRDARKLNALQDGGEWLVLLLTPEMLHGEAWIEFTGILGRQLTARS